MMKYKDFGVNILGTAYTIDVKAYNDDPAFTERSIDGYCDNLTKKIVVCDMDTWPGFEKEPEDVRRAAERQAMRHEIVHAFFGECGLSECALQYNGAWSKNEEMIDWIANVGEKIYAVWEAVGCLS